MFLKDKISSTAADTANLFADFFKSILVPSNDSQSDINYFEQSVDFGNVVFSIDDVLAGIEGLKLSHKLDHEGFSVFSLKTCSSSLAIPLQIIFNWSFQAGVFLVDWKISIITPIHKSVNNCNIDNYRPITKISAISNFFECLMKIKLVSTKKRIIFPYQHGFVTCRSTTTNLLVFTEYCNDTFKSRGQVDVIYTDFSKAFDKVSHRLLLKKLSLLGFGSNILQWIESYLENRSSRVCVGQYSSEPFIATSGVPQGNILGPLLFLLFINDIITNFEFVNCLLFADNLKLFSKINNDSDSLGLLHDLNSLHDWCCSNELFLNIGKCAVVSYSKGSVKQFTAYCIDNVTLNRVQEFRDLGVIFDTKFYFLPPLNTVITYSYLVD